MTRHAIRTLPHDSPGLPPMLLTRSSLACALLALAFVAQLPAQSNERIALRYATFDPLSGEPQIPDLLRAGSRNCLFVVQFADKPDERMRAALRGLGGDVVGFLPHRAHLVRMSATIAAQAAALPGVRWVGAYHPAYRIDASLLDTLVQNGGSKPCNVVLVDKRKDKVALLAKLRAAGVEVLHEQPGSLLVEAKLDARQLVEVANFDEVAWIDESTPIGIDMDNARIQGGANHIEAAAGYLGQGVRGHIYEGVQDTHPDFTVAPIPVLSCNAADNHGHATGGIVFGNGTSNVGSRGMAPMAVPYYTNYACVNVGVSRWQVVEQLVQTHEVSFTTASWGNALTTSYTSITADADDIVFDHGIVWTQSQSNNGDRQSRPQAWAKNVISVGGVRHYDNADPGDDSWAGGASIGPAADGRIKPDLCSFYDAVRTSDRTGLDGYDPSDSTATFGGTSAATPIVAGHNALAIQMFTDGLFGPVRVPGGTRFQNRPNFTTLKALQVACASQYAFASSSTNNRREHQGWGHPSLSAMWNDRASIHVVDETKPLQQGEVVRYRMQVAPGRSELKVAMTFADPAANPAAALTRVNDLTLRAIAPDGTVYWGNHGLRTGTSSAGGGAADSIDTMECVFVPQPIAGVWSIDVIADLVVADSHAATAAMDADFGLAVRGATFAGLGSPGAATAYGASCTGSKPGAPQSCVIRNDTTAKTSVALRASATYAFEVTTPVALEIVGFEVFANSTTGNPLTVPAHVFALDAAGTPSIPLATGSITIGTAPGWTTAHVSTALVAAGSTFCVGFDTGAVPPSAFEATTGGQDIPYHRFENGAWGVRTTGRFEWSIRVLCRPTTTLPPMLQAAGVMDAGHSYELTMTDALPLTFGGISIGISNTSMNGIPLPLPLDVVGAVGCTILSDQLVVGTGFVDGVGSFRMPVSIPNSPYFVGWRIYHQGVVVDPTANAFGYVLTHGIAVQIGG